MSSRTAERLQVLELLKEGKINAEEAHKLIEDALDEEQVGWLNKLLFAFVPMILAIGIGAGLLYCLFFYLPFRLPFEKLALIYGLLAILVLGAVLAWSILMGVGKAAINRKFKVSNGDKKVEFGGPKEKEEPKQDETPNK